jgi:putative hydrolase of the HAD superfamily
MSEDLGVVWDFDGTLAERPGLWSGCLLEVITEHDPDHRIVRQDISALMKTGFPWHTPERAHPDLCDPDAWWGEITTLLASVLERLGFATATARTLASRVRAHYVDANVGWRVFPETEEALRRLSERGCRQVIRNLPP